MGVRSNPPEDIHVRAWRQLFAAKTDAFTSDSYEGAIGVFRVGTAEPLWRNNDNGLAERVRGSCDLDAATKPARDDLVDELMTTYSNPDADHDALRAAATWENALFSPYGYTGPRFISFDPDAYDLGDYEILVHGWDIQGNLVVGIETGVAAVLEVDLGYGAGPEGGYGRGEIVGFALTLEAETGAVLGCGRRVPRTYDAENHAGCGYGACPGLYGAPLTSAVLPGVDLYRSGPVTFRAPERWKVEWDDVMGLVVPPPPSPNLAIPDRGVPWVWRPDGPTLLPSPVQSDPGVAICAEG